MSLILGLYLSVISNFPQPSWDGYTRVQIYDDDKPGGVQFTRPDGTAIFVNPHAVAFVRSSLEGELGKSTIVFASGAKQSVKESIEEVIRGIRIRQPGERR